MTVNEASDLAPLVAWVNTAAAWGDNGARPWFTVTYGVRWDIAAFEHDTGEYRGATRYDGSGRTLADAVSSTLGAISAGPAMMRAAEVRTAIGGVRSVLHKMTGAERDELLKVLGGGAA